MGTLGGVYSSDAWRLDCPSLSPLWRRSAAVFRLAVTAPENPSDVVTFKGDRNADGLPREGYARKKGNPPGQAALWAAVETEDLSVDVWGQYPKRFMAWAIRQLHCDPSEVLHMCSGALKAGTGRARVDIRRVTAPDVVADARKLPFPDDTFRAVLIDPPYSVEYARNLYGTEYPRPSHLLSEASRVAQPCGRIGIVHFLVPMPPKGCRLQGVRGITTGCGYRIRAFSIFEKDQESLFNAAPEPSAEEE